MNLFDLDPGSEHFCRPLSTPPTGAPRSVKVVVENFKGVTHLREGEPRFDTYRLALLSSVERWLLYSASNYRRALDMLVPVAAPWAHVTLYYSSFFAANAILGMFGGYVKAEGKRTVIDVLAQMPDSQEFLITRNPPLPAHAPGTHGAFWAFFYDSAAKVRPWAPLGLAGALTPPAGLVWQTTTRNAVNYDMFCAFEASQAFPAALDPTKFPASISGNLRQQLETTEQMVDLAMTFARVLKLECFALSGLANGSGRLKSQRRLVRRTAPRVVTHSAIDRFLAN